MENGVFDSGYLLDNIEQVGDKYTYRKVEIKKDEQLSEYVNGNKEDDKYEYIKLNGVKYYKDRNNKWFTILNGEKYTQDSFNPTTTPAIEYYKQAKEFTNRVRNIYKLSELKGSHAVDDTGQSLESVMGNYTIFNDDGNVSIEDPNSNFNQQRLAVIRYSIEKNLAIAIANYNNYSGITTNFQMPKLKEDEWDKIVNNISIISFLQGLNIGGKIYNGYSIITNNKNQEWVSEDSIYIVTEDGQYHKANDKDLVENNEISEGVLNIDLERKSYTNKESGATNYYFPNKALRMLYKYSDSNKCGSN